MKAERLYLKHPTPEVEPENGFIKPIKLPEISDGKYSAVISVSIEGKRYSNQSSFTVYKNNPPKDNRPVLVSIEAAPNPLTLTAKTPKKYYCDRYLFR